LIFFCATPIGNLEDITLRVIRILKEADIIAAEDTRQALKLLNHFGISKNLLSYHHHNRHKAAQRIISLAKEGKSIAVISDSGIPGISDPGSELVILAREKGVEVTLLPGANAALTALVLSGMDTSRFVYEGFMPKDNKDRKKRLQLLKNEQRTTIIYEAPHRLLSTFEDLLQNIGNRKIAIARELTKIYEEVLVVDLENAISHFQKYEPKGEFVLILQGAEISKHDEFQNISIKSHINNYIEGGMDKKEAIKQVAQDRGIPKNEVYKHTIEE